MAWIRPRTRKDALQATRRSPRQSQTVAEFLTKHIDTLTGVQPGTVARYRAYVANDIGDSIGALGARSHDDAALWVDEMAADRASAKTIESGRDFVSGTMKRRI